MRQRTSHDVGGPVVAEWLNPLGELLLKLLKFLIVPIVLFTLMVGINQANLSSMGRVGRKLLGFYVLTSALAIAVGLAVALGGAAVPRAGGRSLTPIVRPDGVDAAA